MGAQGFVAQGPVGVSVAFEVAERRGGSAKGPGDLWPDERQTVTAMLAWGTTQCPKGILQSFGQSHKALAP